MNRKNTNRKTMNLKSIAEAMLTVQRVILDDRQRMDLMILALHKRIYLQGQMLAKIAEMIGSEESGHASGIATILKILEEDVSGDGMSRIVARMQTRDELVEMLTAKLAAVIERMPDE